MDYLESQAARSAYILMLLPLPTLFFPYLFQGFLFHFYISSRHYSFLFALLSFRVSVSVNLSYNTAPLFEVLLFIFNFCLYSLVASEPKRQKINGHRKRDDGHIYLLFTYSFMSDIT